MSPNRFAALTSFLLLLICHAPKYVSAVTPSNSISNELDGKAILLSTGHEIKIFVESPPSSLSNNNNDRLLRDSSSNNGISDYDRWITTIDYYHETTNNNNDNNGRVGVEQLPLSAQLSVLWLDTNSQNIYKSTIGHTDHIEELLKSSAITSSSSYSNYRGIPINLNAGHKLNLMQQQDDRSITLQRNVSAYDFTIDRAAKKLFVSFKSSLGHQLCLMSLTDINTPERCYALNEGPATSLQVDYQANSIAYLDKYSRMNVINLKTGLRRHLSSAIDDNDLPVTLTLDKEAKRIYWITGRGTVFSSTYDGTDRRCVTQLKSRRNLLEPFSMKLIKGRLFFSDIKKRSLSSIDISQSTQRSHLDNCINSQRPESDGVLIVETPTVYGFHFVDLGVPEIRRVRPKETIILSPSRLQSSNNYNYIHDFHHIHSPVHSAEYYVRFAENSFVKLPLWALTVICLGLAISTLIVIATIVLIVFKRGRGDLDGLKPFVNDI